MAKKKSVAKTASPPVTGVPGYVVVARKYRPQRFDELLGQAVVCSGLINAIEQNRVGHAYLFTGSRGTGKTSTARILAKCLNCVQGPTTTPCQECDICQGITAGEDVDVLEIDGASNRRIEEIRQLRSNVAIRPSRARYKIYIIDEVHMLTREAFNALLKTLEEPPEHVKFIFCTTEPEKIPITIRSRCQQFDFVPVDESAISERLKAVAAAESVSIDDAAVRLLARRAAGSMRDSQSLLEQVLSCGKRQIEIDDVLSVLGIADTGLIAEAAAHLVKSDTAAAVVAAQNAFRSGVDAGQFAGQLLGFFRDCMMVAAGCDESLLTTAIPSQMDQVRDIAKEFGVERLLAVIQILDEALIKMRLSAHPQVLVEIALVRICSLENLQAIGDLIELVSRGEAHSLRTTTPTSSASSSPATIAAATRSISKPRSKESTSAASVSSSGSVANPASRTKKNEQSEPLAAYQGQDAGASSLPTPLNEGNVNTIWEQVLAQLNDTTAEMARHYQQIDIGANRRLVVSMASRFQKFCNQPSRRSRIEQSIAELTGQPWGVEFVPVADPSPRAVPQPAMSKIKLMRDAERHPLIKLAAELLDARVIDVAPGKPISPSDSGSQS